MKIDKPQGFKPPAIVGATIGFCAVDKARRLTV